MGKGRNNEKLSNVEIRAEEGRKNFGAWVSYWRANPHRFATEHLQISLFIFQQILLKHPTKNYSLAGCEITLKAYIMIIKGWQTFTI